MLLHLEIAPILRVKSMEAGKQSEEGIISS